METLEVYHLRQEVEILKLKLNELIEKFNNHTHEIITECQSPSNRTTCIN